jgi:hypothetical protein
MPRAVGIWREQWTDCDRCGFVHPVSLLQRQNGLLVCRCHGCVDNLDVERRQEIIGRELEKPGEFADEVSDLHQFPGEFPIF